MKQKRDEVVGVTRSARAAMAWLYVLGVCAAVAVAMAFAYGKILLVPEFAQAGDTFGYLQMAADIRHGAAPQGLPRFTLDGEHSQLLRAHFESLHVPLKEYAALLGPNAYHYQAGTGLIVNQYPPGVGLMLSLFPAGHALHGMSFAVMGAPLGGLIAGAGWLVRRGGRASLTVRLAAFGMMGLCCIVGMLLSGISVSYSIDFFCLPMMMVFLFCHLAMGGESGRHWAFALLGGMAFGFGILSRLATGLFWFGFLALLWPRRWTLKGMGRVVCFCVGMVVTGIAPLMIHQQALTGSAFRSTYAGGDVAPASPAYVPGNFMHYVMGEGNTFLIIGGASTFAFCLMPLADRRGGAGVLKRDGAAMALFWLALTAFFLTHAVTTDYYQLPTIQVALFAAAFAGLRLAGKGLETVRAKGLMTAAALLVALVGCGYVLVLPDLPNAESVRMPPVELPGEFRDPHAWIVGDRFTGTLWHYHGLVAHAIVGVEKPVRAEMYRFIAARREPLYVMVDNPTMEPIANELMEMGARFQQVDSFGRQTVFRVEWPSGDVMR